MAAEKIFGSRKYIRYHEIVTPQEFDTKNEKNIIVTVKQMIHD